MTLLDTADVYGDGRSEERIRKALAPRSDRPFVATKAGRRADPFEAAQYTPENLRAWIDRSRRNLGVDTLDLVQLHCPPPAVYSDQRVYDTPRLAGRGGEDRRLRRLGGDGRRGADGARSTPACSPSRSSSTSSGASRWRSCCRRRRRPASASWPACPLASGLLTGKYDESTTFPADDHRNFNRHGEAFDVGETFAGVAVRGRRRRRPGGRRDRRRRHADGRLRAALGHRPARRHHRHPRRPQRRRRSGQRGRGDPRTRSPTPSSPTSSGCTTSASAPTCTTAGEPAHPLKGTSLLRTHDAGTLRASDAGSTVTLAGWVARRRDHGGVVFLDLRDASGYVQVVVREEEAHHLRNEYCVLVTGEVRRRPEGNENPELPTGEIEVATTDAARCSRRRRRCRSRSRPTRRRRTTSATSTATSTCAGRARRRRMRVRSEISRIARDVHARHGFAEVETPNLTRSTPEGARDFVVPVRLQPGKWYALPQSPQLFKQLLMIGGLERYYQIARCFRDEDFRADRQPEFTQLDFEMSFVDRDDVLAIAEDVVRALWRELAGYEVPAIPRMTYREAMDRFGSDKPDLRFGIELTELTDYFCRHPVPGVPVARYVGAVVMPGGGSQPRRALRRLAGLGQVARRPGPGLRGPIAEDGEARRPGRQEHLRRRAGRAGRRPSARSPATACSSPPVQRRASQELLGAARNEIAKRLELDRARHAGRSCSSSTSRCSRRPRSGDWTFMHHPFTSPTPEWRERFADDKGAALSDAYDMVINGNEVDERLGAYPRRRRAGAGLRDARHVAARRPGSGSGSSSRRSPTARRRTPAPRSAGTGVCAARRRGLDPRGHRLPEDPRRLRPADRRADADHRGAAQGGGHRRQAGGAAAARRAGRARAHVPTHDAGGRREPAASARSRRSASPAGEAS